MGHQVEELSEKMEREVQSERWAEAGGSGEASVLWPLVRVRRGPLRISEQGVETARAVLWGDLSDGNSQDK